MLFKSLPHLKIDMSFLRDNDDACSHSHTSISNFVRSLNNSHSFLPTTGCLSIVTIFSPTILLSTHHSEELPPHELLTGSLDSSIFMSNNTSLTSLIFFQFQYLEVHLYYLLLCCLMNAIHKEISMTFTIVATLLSLFALLANIAPQTLAVHRVYEPKSGSPTCHLLILN